MPRRSTAGSATARTTKVASKPHRSSHHDLWKGLAILAVVLIHVLSSKRTGIFYQWHPYHLYFTFFDQLLRFCVPIFVALSGYGLMAGYVSKFNLLHYLKRRVVRLLPLYIWWSLMAYVVFWLVPHWDYSSQATPFWRQLWWGTADYQMYFVPMIVQLYLLFPLLRWFFLRWPKLVLAGAWLAQLWMISQAMSLAAASHHYEWVGTHYIKALSWVGYFVTGMYLSFKPPQIPTTWQTLAWLERWVWFAGAVLAAGFLAATEMAKGQDALVAMRFTRLPIVVMSVAAIFLAAFEGPQWPIWQWPPLNWWRSFLTWCGRYSFEIFLSHTLVLRLWFFRDELQTGQLSYGSWLAVAGTILVGLLAPIIWGKISQLKKGA